MATANQVDRVTLEAKYDGLFYDGSRLESIFYEAIIGFGINPSDLVIESFDPSIWDSLEQDFGGNIEHVLNTIRIPEIFSSTPIFEVLPESKDIVEKLLKVLVLLLNFGYGMEIVLYNTSDIVRDLWKILLKDSSTISSLNKDARMEA